MYDYIIGKITDIQGNAIVIDNNGLGYLVYVSNPYSFEIDKEYVVYIYQYVREDEIPFDFARRRMSVVLRDDTGKRGTDQHVGGKERPRVRGQC